MASTLLLAVVLLSVAATTAMHSPEQQAEFLSATLADLGYQEFARAVKPFYEFIPSLDVWYGPVTVFAPSDDAFRRAQYGRVLILSVHLTTGLHSAANLARLPSGFMLETSGLVQESRRLTVTSAATAAGPPKIFIDGAEITRPDLFNDGRIAIHGLGAVIDPLSPLSYIRDPNPSMREAYACLETCGFELIAVEMSFLEPELTPLRNMTVFALDDQSINDSSQELYRDDVPFHIVPDRLLTHDDLLRLPEGTVLPTLAGGVRRLTVTRSGAAGPELLQINGVSIKSPDLFCNAKIAVHGVAAQFPTLHTTAAASDRKGEPRRIQNRIVKAIKGLGVLSRHQIVMLIWLVVGIVVTRFLWMKLDAWLERIGCLDRRANRRANQRANRKAKRRLHRD